MDTKTTLPDFDALWDYDKPAETEARFRALLGEIESTADLAYRLELMTQLARTQSLQKKFAEAHRILDEIEGLISRVPAGRVTVRKQLERGRTYNSSGATLEAREVFRDAWEMASNLGEDYHAIDALHMLAIVDKGDAAHAWNLKALELTEKTPDLKAKKWLGALYNNIGWTFHDQHNYEAALDMFQKGLAFRETRGVPGPIRIARWTIARTYRSLERVEEALQMQQRLYEEFKASEEGEDGYVSEELGECLLALGRADEARPHFARAYELLSQDIWLKDSEPMRLERLQQLGTPA